MYPRERPARGHALLPMPSFDPAVASRPMRVAHRGGNSRAALRTALLAPIDWIEVDIWWHFGQLVARHDRTLWRTPLTYNRGLIGLAAHPHLTLDEVLDTVAPSPVRLLLDIKGDAPRLPGALVETLRRRGALTRSALCSQDWAPLDAAHALESTLQVCYSLGREEHVAACLRRRDAGSAPPLISIRHSLLTPARIDALHRLGVAMIAWTVNDPDRARDLVRWGADGVTSDSLHLLSGLENSPSR